MVSIERLLERYGHKEYPVYGDCIAIPGSEWHEKWQEDLKVMGYECVRTDFGNPNRPVHLIQLKDQPSKATEATTKEPTRELKETPAVENKYKRGRWSVKDKKRLLEAIGTPASASAETIEARAKAILKDFPGRPLHGLLQQYSMLIKSAALEKALENVCPKCGLPKDLCCCGEEEKETLSQDIKEDLGLIPREEKQDSTRPEKPSKKHKRITEPKRQEPQRAPDDSVKPKLDCNVSIHVEAKSAASIRAVIAMLKELRGTK